MSSECRRIACIKVSSIGLNDMGETFERLAEELVDKYLAPQIELETRVKHIKLLMKNTNMSMDEALDVLNIQGKDRQILVEQLQK